MKKLILFYLLNFENKLECRIITFFLTTCAILGICYHNKKNILSMFKNGKNKKETNVKKLLKENPIEIEELTKYCNSETSAKFIIKGYEKYYDDNNRLYALLTGKLETDPKLKEYLPYMNLINGLKEFL